MSGGASRVRALAGVTTLAALVFLVVPASVYLGNISEFMVAPGPIALVLLVPVLFTLATAIVALRLSGRADFSRLCSVAAAATLMAWTQAYLLARDYGPLDGSPIDWGAAGWRAWLDVPAWLAALAAAAIFHRRLARPLGDAAFAIVALQLAILAWEAHGQRDALGEKPSQQVAVSGFDAMARFSPGRNVVHIVLDSFQADVFKDIIDGPAGPWLRSSLTGFTYFEEHVGTFPGTYLSLPVIVSGQMFRNHMPRAQFVEQAFGGKTILNAAHAAGYEVDIASEAMMLDLLMKGHYDNAYLVSRRPLVQEAARVLDVALFRIAPAPLKPHVYNDQHWLTQALAAPSEQMGFFYFTHNSFLADVARRFSVDRPTPVYKFFHLMTTHAPFAINPDCSYAGRVLPLVRETVTAQSQCSLAFVVALLDRMKQAGIYDDSLIVLMADHGGHVPPHRYVPAAIVQDGVEYELAPALVGVATPLLAIKPPAATHPLEVSAALTSMADVPATIDAVLGLRAGVPGASLLDPGGTPARERVFFGVKRHRDETLDYLNSIDEFRITGSAYEAGSWRLAATYPRPDGGALR